VLNAIAGEASAVERGIMIFISKCIDCSNCSDLKRNDSAAPLQVTCHFLRVATLHNIKFSFNWATGCSPLTVTISNFGMRCSESWALIALWQYCIILEVV
jgi:hypothetical protein